MILAPQQLNSLLSSWPELLSTASKLDEQSAAKILSGAINNNEESRVDEGDNQEELLRLGSEWLLRELFKGVSLTLPTSLFNAVIDDQLVEIHRQASTT